jgi:hypothetical protein
MGWPEQGLDRPWAGSDLLLPGHALTRSWDLRAVVWRPWAGSDVAGPDLG